MDREPVSSPHQILITRRVFLRMLGASSLLLMAGCAPTTPPTPQAAPAPTAAPTVGPATPVPPPTSAPVATAASVAPKRGGTLKYALNVDVTNLDPQIITEAAGARIKSMVYSNLVKYQGDTIVGDLAESWETVDPTTWVFRLRKGVQFHNGDELTAEDVKFTLDRIIDPKTKASLAGEYTPSVAKTEVVDPYTVRILLKQPNAALLALLALDRGSGIASKKYAASNDLQTKMMGTGPFKFVEQVPGVHVKTVRNDNYFLEGKPYLDGIDWLPYSNSETRTTALRTGAVDIMMTVQQKDIDTLEKEAGIVYKPATRASYLFLMFRTDRPPFDNQELRKAVNWSIDRDALVKLVVFDRGEPMTGGFFPSSWPTGSPELKGTYGFDVAKAQSILKAAGLTKPKFTIFSSTYASHQKTAEIVHSQLTATGLYDVDLELVEQAVATDRRTKGEFQVMMYGSPLLYGDPNGISRWLETGAYYPKSMHFSDQQIDDLLAQGRATTDVAARKKIYNQLEKRMLDLAPFVFMINQETGDAWRAQVQGYQYQNFAPVTTLVETWLQ